MTESQHTKVFCMQCKYLVREGDWMPSRNLLPVVAGKAFCLATTKLDPVFGEVDDPVKAAERNKGFDCKLYEAKPPAPAMSPKAKFSPDRRALVHDITLLFFGMLGGCVLFGIVWWVFSLVFR